MKKINYTFLFALAICVNLDARAQGKPNLKTEKWQCFSTSDFSKRKALVKLTRDGVGGLVSVAGTTQFASVAGFDRRWDFGLDDGKYQYAFIIEPDGSGRYYDFSRSDDGTASPSQFFDCVQR